MLLFNAPRNSQGFTLIETLVIVIIIGILSAIAAPSFLALLNRNKVNGALSQVRGALQEAQREASRKSKNCTVSVPKSNVPNVATTVSSNCFVTGNRTLDGINIDHDKATDPWTITFDLKGRTDSNSAGTMVFSLPDTSQQKCLVVSQGLGLIRTGDYVVTGATSACNTPQ